MNEPLPELTPWLAQIGTDNGGTIAVPLPTLIGLYVELGRLRAADTAWLNLCVEQIHRADTAEDRT